MNIKTTFEGIDASERNWHLVDASGLPIGRLASEIAQILRGKHKPQYAPHLDVGDHVVVVNASEIAITSKKPEQKMYHSHSGFPGGIKSESFNSLRQRKPERIIERAVWGMLPKNRLGRSILKKLHIYANDQHPHESQKPQELIFNIKKVEGNG
jgi:large subunit ribosomal protein L13|tara:strand:- start:254 stop:715 length:462 start_codon:yes stop_codon:yes gene_type:complete